MSMTKKDYELIAKAVYLAADLAKYDLLVAKDNNDLELHNQATYRLEGVKKSAEYTAEALQEKDKRFKRDEFLKLCGVKD